MGIPTLKLLFDRQKRASRTKEGATPPSARQQAEVAPQPVGKGVFGSTYNQFKGKAKAAIDFLLSRKEGNAVGALHHKDVGDIDLWYGDDNVGLKKIAQKHPEVLEDLQGVIDKMRVVQASENRVILESDTHRAVVSKDWYGKKADNWLLTAYEKKGTSGGSIDIVPEPETGRQNGTAPLQDSLSDGKDSDNSANVQGNGEIVSEPMPVGEDGEEDWQATTPERAHAYIFNEAGLSRSEGNEFIAAQTQAARDNTDGAYVNYLKEYASKFGFTAEQVEAMQHPRVSFVPDEAMPYTAETFAKFNQQEMKSQNKTEQAVKLGKTVSDDSFRGIVRTINGYDTLGDFYNDAEASLGAVYDLHNAGVVPQAQLAEMVDGIRGQEKLSAVGREFLENMLIGKAFESDTEVVRMLTAEPAMRQTVITALGEIVDNIALGGDWSLQGELADAVKLCFDARQGGAKYGEIVSTYARQGVLFADPDELQTVADFNNATMLMLADVLNDNRVTLLKTTLQLYNNNARQSAVGQADLFAGGIQSREDILRDVITFINENYGKRKEIEAARAEAVERRKAESVQQDGIDGESRTRNEEANTEVPSNDGGGSDGSIEQRQSDTTSSEEVDENGIPFVKAADGTTVFGEIREDSGLQPAPIRLSEGSQDADGKGYGLAHIEANHGEQIRNAGFASVEDFVAFVAKNYDEDNIRVGKRRDNGNTTYLIQVQDEHDNTLFIELSRDGSYWNVNSAGIFRKGYSNKKETVAKTEPQQPNNAVSTGSSLSADEVSGITSTEPNGEPTVSGGKVSDNSATVQEKTEKVAENQTPNAVQAALAAAEQETNTEPTEAQKEAGNYKKGHVKIDGYDVTIENPKGSVRRGTDASGKQWEQKMQNTLTE